MRCREIFTLACFVLPGFASPQTGINPTDLRSKKQGVVAASDSTSAMDSFPQWIPAAKSYVNSLIRDRIKTLKKTGDLWEMRGDLEKARVSYEKALLLAEKNSMTTELIWMLTTLHNFHFGSADRKQTLYYIMRGIRVAETTGNDKALLDFNSFLAKYYTASGDTEKALQMQLRLLEMYKRQKDDQNVAGLLMDIGATYAKTGRKEKTIYYYLESKKYLKAVVGTVHIVELYVAIGEAYRYQKNYDSAEVYLHKAYAEAQKRDHPAYMASTLVVKGYLADEKGEYDKAEKYALKALELTRQANFRVQLLTLYALLKNIYAHQGKYKKALDINEDYIREKDSLSGEKERKAAAEKEYAYNLEKKENRYRLLKQQAEIKDLQLQQHRYIYIGSGIALLIVVLGILLFVRQKKYKTKYLQVQLEQKLLRAQMNPHFVFNSLGSIQQFVMENKNDKAELYLVKFSTLMRNLLESNIKDNLTIGEEILMLQAYIEMEAMRFGSRFSYSVEVDKNVNLACNIPHLMLQPFVENAIWHGLLPSPGERLLQVKIEADTPVTIRCTIDDNGIGREASLKKSAAYGKKSLALDFVNQRISLIKKIHGIEGSIGFLDKKDASGKASGTTVTLIIPIIQN